MRLVTADLNARMMAPNDPGATLLGVTPPGLGLVGAQRCCAPTKPKPGGVTPNNVAPGSLGVIIRAFKSAVTKRINQMRGTPGAPVWQRNYYEHIIRNENSLNRIRQYIETNPLRWMMDRENVEKIRTNDFDG